MPTVRIGCVQYLNAVPLIEGLRTWKDGEVITAVPSRLIHMLMDKQVDVALASVIDAAVWSGSGTGAVLLPAGMIGCDGPTLTVRVFSRVEPSRITRVHVDTDSHTSRALCAVVLRRLTGRVVELVDFDARERVAPASPSPIGEWPEAVLLIGDKVITDPPPAGVYPHQLDLGAAWKELTGLPFVYAVWMCRAGEEDSEAVRTAFVVLDRARRHNQTRMDWVVATHASKKHWPLDQAQNYLGRLLRYEVGEPEREAVEKFVRMAAELGLAGSGGGVGSVRWAG